MKTWVVALLAMMGTVTCATAAKAKDRAKHHRVQVLPAAMFPPTDCEAYVAYDRDMKMPGILPTRAGPGPAFLHHRRGASPSLRAISSPTSPTRSPRRWEKCKNDKDATRCRSVPAPPAR